MKLKIEPQKISFRLDMTELDQLLRDGEIADNTPLPTEKLAYQVVCLPPQSEPSFQNDDMILTLSLPRDKVEAHKAELPSLRGIATEFATPNGPVTVTLEINLKKKLKRSLLA